MSEKRHWTRFNMMREDPPAWALSVKLSLIGGISFLVSTAGGMAVRHRTSFSEGIFVVASTILSITFVCAPALAALRARRYYMWYGFLPYSLAIPWFLVVYVYNAVHPLKGLVGASGLDSVTTPLMIGALFVWLLAAGPISAVKYSIDRAKQAAAKRDATLAADMRIDLEGSWPPKPTAHSAFDGTPDPPSNEDMQ
jgi:hypothetical protein